MIRFESQMLHVLAVPLQPEKGNKSRMLKIPAATANGPGVIEIPEIDSIVLARLKHHYERRVIEGKMHEVGLLKITFTDDAPSAA